MTKQSTSATRVSLDKMRGAVDEVVERPLVAGRVGQAPDPMIADHGASARALSW